MESVACSATPPRKLWMVHTREQKRMKESRPVKNNEQDVAVVVVVVVVDAGKGAGCGETGGSFIYPNHGSGD